VSDGEREPKTGGDDEPPSLPVVESPPIEQVGAVDTGVHGLLLAAGTSSRFGEANKLLAEVEGEPIVRRAAETLLASSLASVTVVTGHEAERVRSALADLDVTVVHASDYDAGQGHSVARGVAAVREAHPDATGVLVALGDMPDVSALSVDRLVAAFEAEKGSALAAAFGGERGNPVLFGAEHFDALATTAGDTGARALLLGGDDSVLVETADPGVRRDIDRRSDLDERREEGSEEGGR
jgi:molybdenum cofactor cytidylyltransferase